MERRPFSGIEILEEVLPHADGPHVMEVPGQEAGPIAATPYGVILHGTRSGQSWDRLDEFMATVNYVRSGGDGLGWHATIGEGIIALHMPPDRWGWHAGSYSRTWLGVEFAQPAPDHEITDAQVAAFAWWWRHVATQRWPELQPHFVAHSETQQGIQAGKSDPFPVGDVRNDALRRRILSTI